MERLLSLLFVCLCACSTETVLFVDLTGLRNTAGADNVALEEVSVEVWAVDMEPQLVTVPIDTPRVELQVPEGIDRRVRLIAWAPALGDATGVVDNMAWYWGMSEVDVFAKQTQAIVNVEGAGLLRVQAQAIDEPLPNDLALSLFASAQVPVVGTVQPFPLDDSGLGLMALPAARDYGISVSTDAALELPGELVAPLTQGVLADVTAYLIPPGTKCHAGRPAEVWEADPPCRSIGGVVSGLRGEGLTLHSNTGEFLEVTQDGSFRFPTGLLDGESFLVTISEHPEGPSQTCFAVGSGGVVTGDITVTIQCNTDTFTLFADVENLVGSGLRLVSDSFIVPIPTNGVHQIRADLEEGASLSLGVQQQPAAPTQKCEVTLPTESIGTLDVIADVVCRTPVGLSGTVSGLKGSGLVLENNGETVTVANNGPFAFAAAWLDGETYAVSVHTAPSGPQQTCIVQGGTGTFGHVDVESVFVSCSTDEFSLHVDVAGLDGTMLLRSGTRTLFVTQDGLHQVRDDLAEGDALELEISSVPTDPVHDCTLELPFDLMGTNDVTAIVTCRREYTVAGTVSGLVGTGLVLENNGESVPIDADGPYQFPTPQLDGEAYDVVVATAPTGPRQQCSVANGSGVLQAHVADADVSCVVESYPLEVVVTGLDGTVVLENAGEELVVTSNGSFTFPTSVDDEASYEISLVDSPSSQQCTLSAGSGRMDGAAAQATVDCLDLYSVEVRIEGLAGTLALSLNSDPPLSFTTDGSFPLGGLLTEDVDYAVAIDTQSVGTAYCTVLSGSGSYSGAELVTVDVICLAQPTLATSLWNHWVRPTGGACQANDARRDCELLSGQITQTVVGAESCTEVLGIADALGAFRWSCDDTGPEVLAISSGLAEGVGLIALLDVDAGSWAENQVIVDLDRGTVQTRALVWWDNPVAKLLSGSVTLAGTDTVLVIAGEVSGQVTISGDRNSVVTSLGGGLLGSTGPTVVVNQADFTWIEGDYEHTGAKPVLDLTGATGDSVWTTVRNARFTGGSLGIALNRSVRGLFEDVVVTGVAGDGIGVEEGLGFIPRRNLLRRVLSAHNDGDGFHVLGNENVVVDSVSAFNAGHGVHVNREYSERPLSNRFFAIRSYANAGHGIALDNADSTSLLQMISVGNDGSAMAMQNAYGTLVSAGTFGDGGAAATLDWDLVSQFNTLHDSVIFSGVVGVELTTLTDSLQVRDVAILDHDDVALSIDSANDIVFDGELVIYDSQDCDVPASGEAGLFDDCSIAGASTATVTFAADSLADSFLGNASDAQHPNGGSGSALFTPQLDAWTFESPARTWAISGPALDPTSRGACRSGLCQIRDWSLQATDPWLLDRAGTFPPAGTDAFVHRFFVINAGGQADCDKAFTATTYNPSGGTCDAVGLLGALEFLGDGIGDDDGLCESEETCLWLQHLGAWQGDGPLVGPTALTAPSSFLANLSLFTY